MEEKKVLFDRVIKSNNNMEYLKTKMDSIYASYFSCREEHQCPCFKACAESVRNKTSQDLDAIMPYKPALILLPKTGSAADVAEIMKKYDRESNTRIWEGKAKVVVNCILAAFSLFPVKTVIESRVFLPSVISASTLYESFDAGTIRHLICAFGPSRFKYASIVVFKDALTLAIILSSKESIVS